MLVRERPAVHTYFMEASAPELEAAVLRNCRAAEQRWRSMRGTSSAIEAGRCWPATGSCLRRRTGCMTELARWIVTKASRLSLCAAAVP